MFKFLTKEKFRIHQDKCIQNWDSIKKELIDSDEEEKEEEENEKEPDRSNIDRK